MNSRCKTKYYKIRAGGFLDVTPECKLTSLDILRTHVKLLATELRGKTIKESIGLTNHTFQKVQEIFLGILTRWNLFQDVKLFGFIQWDEAHVCGKNTIKYYTKGKPGRDSGGLNREIKLGHACEIKPDGSLGKVKTYVIDCMDIEMIVRCLLDSIDLTAAKVNVTQLRTDMLVQNDKTVSYNNWKQFKFDYRNWNHSHPTNPHGDPEDETNNTQRIEILNRLAKEELPVRHRTIRNCRDSLHCWEFKKNSKVTSINEFGLAFSSSATALLEKDAAVGIQPIPKAEIPSGFFEDRRVKYLTTDVIKKLCKLINRDADDLQNFKVTFFYKMQIQIFIF